MKPSVTRLREILATQPAVFARLRAAPGQALPMVLPVAVIGLFLWWFSSIPPYPATKLSAGWTPGAPQWATEWRSYRAPVGVVQCDLVDDSLELGHMLIRGSSSSRRNSYAIVDIESGAVLAEYQAGAAARLERTEMGWKETELGIGAWPAVRTLDPLTLKPIQEVQLQSSSITPPAGMLFPTAFLTLPDGTHRGILGISQPPTTQISLPTQANRPERKPTPTFWFKAAPTGEILDFRNLDCPNCFWRPDPTPDSNTWYSTSRNTGSARKLAIDLFTGRPAEYPVIVPVKVEGSGRAPDARASSDDRLTHPARGWTDASRTTHRRPTPCIFPELSLPFTFRTPPGREPGSDASWRGQLTRSMAKGRRALWGLRYSQAELDLARVRALRIDGITLHTDAATPGNRRALTGDLAETLAYELKQQHFENATNPQKVMSSSRPASVHPNHLDMAELNCALRPLPDGAHLVVQVMHHAPKSVLTSGTLLRLGVLKSGAADATWFGWIAAPDLERQTLGSEVSLFEFIRMGDKLLISRPGRAAVVYGTTQVQSLDFLWTLIPLPTELTDLPEGPL